MALGRPSTLVLRVVGATMLALSAGMGLCAVFSLLARDGAALSLALPALIALGLGAPALWKSRGGMTTTPRVNTVLLATTLAWVTACGVGAAPFLLSGVLDRPVDAAFESMSGFTTTGATLMVPGIEDAPPSVVVWRSATQWLGGLGFVVLIVAATPTGAAGLERMLGSEASGPTSQRRTPRIADTAKLLWTAYLALTVLGLAGFWAAGMSLFDAANHVMAAVSTGGFSTREGSIGDFDSLAIELVAIAIMVLGATSFALYASVLARTGPYRPQIAELGVMVAIIATATLAVSASLLLAGDVDELGTALRVAAFQMTSLLTATGLSTQAFDQWNEFALLLILVLVFVGGCAGSTAGGLKVVRVMLLAQILFQELRAHVDPHRVGVLRIGGRVHGEDVRRGVLVLVLVWVIVFGAASIALAAMGLGFRDAVGSAAATLNTVGPSIGETLYADMPEPARVLLIVCMLLGRLEIMTVVLLVISALSRSPGR